MQISGSPQATSQANNPAGGIAATDVQSAINELDTEKENVANKDTDILLAANSDTKYPSQKAIKTFASNLAGAEYNLPIKQALGSVLLAETMPLENASANQTLTDG